MTCHRQRSTKLSKTFANVERVRFGRWWTFWAHDVNSVVKKTSGGGIFFLTHTVGCSPALPLFSTDGLVQHVFPWGVHMLNVTAWFPGCSRQSTSPLFRRVSAESWLCWPAFPHSYYTTQPSDLTEWLVQRSLLAPPATSSLFTVSFLQMRGILLTHRRKAESLDVYCFTAWEPGSQDLHLLFHCVTARVSGL